MPFKIKEDDFYFSFYEVEKKSGAMHLLPIMTDVALNAAFANDDFETYAATDEIRL